MTPEQERQYLAHVNDTCPGCEQCDEELRWEAIWNGPKAAEVKATNKAVAEVCRQSYAAEYRCERALPTAMSDRTVLALMDIESVGKRGQ